MNVTTETLTRLQIRDLMDSNQLSKEDFILCMIALHGPTVQEEHEGLTVAGARARCAELYNARTDEQKEQDLHLEQKHRWFPW